ncbi:class I SAM-dependent methyltransferase [Martelella alba]|uniref:Class I SAM-dependent methyltransferase n=1 Tax=Martelella alba TaxID=2590451 RepID=A0A506UET5_9HYPH|nr:class I SAM-dependent methyltransferase [Martelella alba]TPW31405.1 class I SAM-dependent methyltransferase [Martelella alba]
MSEDRTFDFYNKEASVYAGASRVSNAERLSGFLKALPPGASILELGCGAGFDSAFMLAAGFDVTPSDGSPEMVREAEARLGRPVRLIPFEALEDAACYDGIWANACLLHVPRDRLAGVFMRIFTAMRAGGLFYASYKTGKPEGFDAYGRYYNYPERDALLMQYQAAGFRDIRIEARAGGGYGGEKVDWLYIFATRPNV